MNSIGYISKVRNLMESGSVSPNILIASVLADCLMGKTCDFSNFEKRLYMNGRYEKTLSKLHSGFNENKFPGISKYIRNKLKIWIDMKLDIFQGDKAKLIEYLIGKLSENPEIFISGVLREAGIDLYEKPVAASFDLSPDIPVQAAMAIKAGVPSKYNASIGVLKDSGGEVVINQEVIDGFVDLVGPIMQSDSFFKDIMGYQPGVGMEHYRKAMEFLIRYEEETYSFPKIKGKVSRPYFVPGGTAGLSMIFKYIVGEGDTAIIPNYNWPNVEGIISSNTRIFPLVLDLIRDDGFVDVDVLSTTLSNLAKSGRKKVVIYLNFPNNPTGVTLSVNQSKKFNDILRSFSVIYDMKIDLVLDDPYGAFSINNSPTGSTLRAPLSYYITPDDNVTIYEFASHGTKEAGVYGMRASVMRVISSENNKATLDKKVPLWIRETFSMSPALPQLLLACAVLGEVIFSPDFSLESLTYEDTLPQIQKYMQGRQKMLEVVFPKLYDLKSQIIAQCGSYLQPMNNIVNGSAQTGGFFTSFTLTPEILKKGITLKDLQSACMNADVDNKCFFIVSDGIGSQKCMRVSLVSGSTHEYARRLKCGFDSLLK